MGLIDKLKQLTAGRSRASGGRRSKAPRKPPGGHESLPGGASGREAAEANPARAKELAD